MVPIVHLASIQRQTSEGTWVCRDPSPTWCSPTHPLEHVTTDRELCTCIECLRAEARVANDTCDLALGQRDELREGVQAAAAVVRWVHSGAGSERAPRRIMAAARDAVRLLPPEIHLLDQASLPHADEGTACAG